MDWKKTFNLGQWVIHSILLISILATLGLNIFAFRLNNIQASEEAQVSKMRVLIQFLKQDHSFEKIGKYLSWAQSDKAHDKMNDLNKKIAETEELLEIKVTPDLSQNLRTFNKLITKNSGMSHPSDALKLMNQKVFSLNQLALTKKYSNIIKITNKMKERLNSLNPKNVGGSIQVSYLNTDIKQLQQLILKSSLDEAEKASLNQRINSMNDEMELLGSLNSQSRNLKTNVTQAGLALGQWLLEVDKKAINLQGLRARKQNKFIIMLSGLVAFFVLSWMALAYLFRWQRNKISGQIEAEVKNVIEKGILEDQRFMVDHYSEGTREEIVRLLDDLKIKLNLGTLLHEGLPFAGCMIDFNFKLTWYNNLFLDQLYLSEEEVRSDAFNWDYVRDYLNLKEDPIYQAMVNKIAGIYPVKVKQDEFASAQPYEMYVTPMSANREGRVMVFFYPLISVKDAIDEQVSLSKSCINKFVSKWDENQLNEDELRLLERDFQNQDLKDLFHNLATVHERNSIEKTEYLHSIHSLERENTHLHSVMEDYKEADEEKRRIIKEEVKAANELRKSFMTSMERTESLLHINKTILQQSDDFKNEAFRLHQVSLEALKKGKESMEILVQLDAVKVDYKKLKFELMEVKAKLITLNNSLLANLPPLDENQQKLAMRYKDELARLDFSVATLEKKLSQLDMLLSKLSMINEKQPIEQTSFSFQTTQKDHEIREAILEIQKGLNQEENKVLEQFKNLHGLMKKEINATNQATLEAAADNFLS
jgi:hypothetical protein